MSGVQEGKHWFKGEMLTTSQLYAKGIDDEYQRSLRANRTSVQGVVDEIKGMILGANRTSDEEPVPTWWPYFTRAAEHIVSDVTGAPTGAKQFAVTPAEQWSPRFAEDWIASAMPILRYTRMIESLSGQPIPMLPALSTPPTAGTRAGEKQAMYSRAFDITDAATTDIDAGLYLNVSQVIFDMGYMPLVNLLMRAAVASEASKQVAQAVETAAGTGGLANFTGNRYQPSVVVVPPEQLDSVNASNLVAAGFTVVIDTHVTKVLYVDPNAIIGYFKQGRIEQPEPSTYGVGVAFNAFGKVAIDGAGVAAVTTP